MKRLAPTLAALAVTTLLATAGCSKDTESDTTGSALTPSHDLAVHFLRECELGDARIMAQMAARNMSAEDDGEDLLAHIDLLTLLTTVGRASSSSGPVADGCVEVFFVAPYRDPSPRQGWRVPEQVRAIADTLTALEQAGTSLEPQKPASQDPRFTFEVAAHLTNLDQYDRVESLLGALPEGLRSSWWPRYLTTIVTVRRAVNADWRDYDACQTASDALAELLAECEEDRSIAYMAPVVLFNKGMVERQMRKHKAARASIERALVHAESRGEFRNFLNLTWTRL